MERVIAVNSNCYHGYGIFECLEGIHKAGFHYVELTATKGWTEHVFPDQSFEFLESVKDKMEELFLTPIALSGHCNLMDRERLQDFYHEYPSGRILWLPVYCVVCGGGTPGGSDKDWRTGSG